VSVALTGCAGESDDGVRIRVILYHCGFEPLTFGGRVWEAPTPPPFDQTNAPEEWQGEGRIMPIGADQLRYIDDSGIEVLFVPDDGVPPGPCA
jgi:hypothetical protein